MRINLPDIPAFIEANRIMIVGAGGGFDVYSGIPIGLELTDRDKEVHYISFGNKDKTYSDEVLGHHFGSKFHCIPRMGVQPYRKLAKELLQGFDAVVLCDGGVDSLMRGDERNPGTLLEDSVSLAVYHKLEIPVILASLGMGSEVEEQLCHYRALENISALFMDGFAGCCALTYQMKAFLDYKTLCEQGWSEGHRVSHIQSRIIESVGGTFGEIIVDSKDARVFGAIEKLPFISPLMAIFWFFDAHKVASRNLLVPKLEPTTTGVDVTMIYRQHLNELAAVRSDQLFTL